MAHGGGRLVLAVGGRHQWHSDEPLPDEAKVVDLVAVSSDDPGAAVELWDVFLRYLHVGGSSGIERFLVSLGLRRIRVRVAISDQRVRDLVVSAIGKNRKAFRLVPLNA